MKIEQRQKTVGFFKIMEQEERNMLLYQLSSFWETAPINSLSTDVFPFHLAPDPGEQYTRKNVRNEIISDRGRTVLLLFWKNSVVRQM